MRRVKIQVSLVPELAERLDQLCEEYNASRSQVMEDALRERVKKEDYLIAFKELDGYLLTHPEEYDEDARKLMKYFRPVMRLL